MDTYGGSLSDPMSLHKYLFANSNPIMYCDPSGHMTLSEECGVMACIGAMCGALTYVVDAFINYFVFSICESEKPRDTSLPFVVLAGLFMIAVLVASFVLPVLIVIAVIVLIVLLILRAKKRKKKRMAEQSDAPPKEQEKEKNDDA